jgi:hypothetical protein
MNTFRMRGNAINYERLIFRIVTLSPELQHCRNNLTHISAEKPMQLQETIQANQYMHTVQQTTDVSTVTVKVQFYALVTKLSTYILIIH